MDYRHTEDFARTMAAAELRARGLREEALDAFFAAAWRALRALWRRLGHRGRSEQILPEA